MALEVPEFLQVKSYSAQDVRASLLDIGLRPGVFLAGDLKVTQRGAGANMSVDVAPGSAWVDGSVSARQGKYHCYNDAAVNLVIAANASGNPRVDQIVLHVYDSVDGAAGQDAAVLEVVQGTGTAGAQITNAAAANYRAGAGALPVSSIRLADILVANGAASITNANIVDRRPWARGYYFRNMRTGGDYSTASTTFALLDANLAARVEVGSSGLLEVAVRGSGTNTTNSGEGFALSIRSDGVDAVPSEAGSKPQVLVPGISFSTYFNWVFTISVNAGSHLIQPFWRATVGTAVIRANANNPLEFDIREVVQQNANNGTA